ncbi:MAG: ATP-binding cassette domain-containing protein [Bacteroidetes bacterium]|nr:ATP-binding cassette domain-containing protein [Bacteroidota bacterium]MBL6944877.1 ATP-binding cassette domain-containing protein [Bacteroidales bacterium]
MISVSNIKKVFGGYSLFEGVSFNINLKDRIGLAGVNGAGKSTLLKIMAGELEPDLGRIIIPPDVTIGYLPQEKFISSDLTVFNEAMQAFKFIDSYKNEIEKIHRKLESKDNNSDKEYSKLIDRLGFLDATLNIYSPDQLSGNAEKYLMGLGFKRQELFRPMVEFSLGWQMRVEIAKLLLLKPTVLLLDEPTNHLDIESIQWVEDFLISYSGAVIVVSHDRTLLDNITNRTIEISNGRIYDYKAAYSEYFLLREERELHLQATYNNQQREINDVQRFIERFRYKASKAKQVQSRVKQLDRMDKLELDNLDRSTIHFSFPPAPHSGKVTLDGKNISKQYGDSVILDSIDFEILKGEKVAFLGRNGEGKSTLAKIIAGSIPFTGNLNVGYQVITGYFAQDQADMLDTELTVFETIDNVAVGDIRKRINSILGAFLFQGDDINKKVKVLSGGEKSRLSLALLLLQPSNLLLLDEPTNHLDLRSKDILKNALLQFDGTLVIVSHDRDFLQGLTNRLYEFKNKGIKEFRGDIELFLEDRKLESLKELESNEKSANITKNKNTENKTNWKNKKEQDKKVRKLKSEISRLEKIISNHEFFLNSINEKLAFPEKNEEEIKSGDLYKQHDNVNTELNDAFGAWEKKQHELDSMEDR